MSYGFQASNNSGSITISDKYRVLVFSERGFVNVLSSNTDRPGYGSVSLVKPLTTAEPPSIYVRYASGSHSSFSAYFTWIGGPGNWTGFRITSAAMGGGALQNHSIEWVCCKFVNTLGIDAFGMQIFDSSGNPVYNTSEKVVKYGKFTKLWSFDYGAGYYTQYFSNGISVDLDDFISISSFDRGVVWAGNGNVQFAGLQLLAGGVRVLRMITQMRNTGYVLQNPSSYGYYFCIPLCKFPSDVYTNT